jgi:hypothetical protein
LSPWDRQRNEYGELEPNLWFGRFTRLYLVAGPERSLLGAYNAWREEEGKSGTRTRIPGAWDVNSKKWDWKRRAEAWDAENRRAMMEEEEEARREMLRRHARQAQAMQGIGAQGLRELAQRVAELTANEIRQLIMDGVKLERQAIGLPEHLLQVAQMTDDELIRRYEGLLASITNTGGDAGGNDAAWSSTGIGSSDESA